MKFKLIIVLTQDDLTDTAISAARAKGATGSTVITSARGEGLKPTKTFLGLSVAGQRDMILLLVEAHHSRLILESIAEACGFESDPGSGMAFQIDIEDAIGLSSQITAIKQEIDKEDL
ncbi:P-II family nitrogen regulator [Alisedimentitalea sp. MJ-SS2]|uniref:P-II family nitrogen regulator n=1 Tax=Aliisedimentitalea sp. MJ-SS2 TaxID=3049795 RepID=UPI0029070D87|nr:P-II family nitrogen regulator [Alisedimentitalea sp. MJ-SS2]MDU8929700.1 P-II family nitrogen regulator [Alisedimentitalea sp. MJ-SS2]